jgi:putative ABC transport system permease protein
MLFLPHGGFLPWAVVHPRLRPGARVLDGRAIREAIWAVDGSLPIPTLERLADRLGTAVATPRFNVVVLAVLGSVALALSLAALYGLVLFALRTRLREIGVRLALGAGPERVVRLLVRRGAAVVAAGLLGGVILSVGFGRSLEALVYGTSGRNPWVLGAAAVLVGATALVAPWIPASRATSVDPRETLNAE